MNGTLPSPQKLTSAGEATSGSVYSNTDPLSYQSVGYFSGGGSTVGTNTISNLLMDDIHTSSSVGGGNIGQITFSYFNGNDSAVSVRLRTRYFAADGVNGGPGTYLYGASFTATVAAGGGGRSYFTPAAGALNLSAGTTIWAGIAFDNNGGAYATTAAQLANFGQLVYDPPVVGTSNDSIWESSTAPADGGFLTNNPAGSTFSSGTTAFAANLGWEFVGPNVTIAPSNWNVDADGSYTVAANWSNGIPQGVGSTANFGTKITAPRTVTMDSNQGVTTLSFSSPIAYTLTGAGNLSFNALNVTAGSHVANNPLATASGATVTIAAGSQLTATQFNDSVYGMTKLGTGTLAIDRTRAATLTLGAGRIKLIAGGVNPSTIGTLTIAGGVAAPTAAIDVTDNDIIFSGADATTSLATVQGYVKYARDGGIWDRNGITTTSAPAVGSALSPRGIGVITGTEYLSVSAANTAFDGVAVTAANTLLKFTYNGDADFSGKINADDYGHIDGGYQNQNTAGFVADWFHGDFDYSGKIDANDYALIDSAYQQQSGTLREALNALETGVMPTGDLPESLQEVIAHYEEFGTPYANAFVNISVPEPTTISLAGLATAGLLARRRRAR